MVDVGGDSKHLRIEVHHHLASAKFSTAAYVREYVTVQPTYPQSNGKYDRKAEDMAIWAVYDLPWTMGESADEVIARALSFIRERTSRSSVGT